MNDLIPGHQIDESRIRKECIEGKWYYSVTDLIVIWRSTDFHHARNYYHVLKGRLRKNDDDIISHIRQIKTLASDGKRYLADFIDADGIPFLQNHIEPRIRTKRNRVEKRQEDEIADFHPKVIQALIDRGLVIRHHVRLPSGSIVDLIAYSEDKTYFVECKPKISRNKLYNAIGQILCYCSEYFRQVTPAIACYSMDVDGYMQERCQALGIEIIKIEDD